MKKISSSGGKGSGRRPTGVSYKQFSDNWDKVLAAKSLKDTPTSPPVSTAPEATHCLLLSEHERYMAGLIATDVVVMCTLLEREIPVRRNVVTHDDLTSLLIERSSLLNRIYQNPMYRTSFSILLVNAPNADFDGDEMNGTLKLVSGGTL